MRCPLAGRGRRRLRYRRARGRLPPDPLLEAFDYVRRENFHVTIHAGELFGLPSIWEALQFCGAERLGHGVRIVDDITLRPDGPSRWVGWRRSCETGACRSRCAHVQRPHRGGAVGRRPPDRPPAPAPLPGHAQHRQPAHERRVAVERVRRARRGVRDRPRRDGVADDQRDEELIRAVRRAAAAHQRRRQAGYAHLRASETQVVFVAPA